MKKFNNQKRVIPTPLQLQQNTRRVPSVHPPLAKQSRNSNYDYDHEETNFVFPKIQKQNQPTTFIPRSTKVQQKIFFLLPTTTYLLTSSLLIISDTLNSLSSLSQLLHYKQSDLVAKAHTHTQRHASLKSGANMCLTSHGSISKMRGLSLTPLYSNEKRARARIITDHLIKYLMPDMPSVRVYVKYFKM
jgi:hypothetical protein